MRIKKICKNCGAIFLDDKNLYTCKYAQLSNLEYERTKDLILVKGNSNNNVFFLAFNTTDNKVVLSGTYNSIEKTKDKQRIIVINKKDLERNIKLPENLENVVETDTNSIEGIDSLKSKIKEMFNLEKITTKDYTYLSNSRQISLITKAYQSILSAEKSLNESLPIDLIAIDLKECFDLLGQVIGISYTDEIIDNLFENFCVGK